MVLSSDSNTAFITSGGGLEIVDVSDASNPRSLSTFYGNSIIDVTLSKDENTAYVTGYYGLYAIDISDRSEPKLLTYAATRNLSSLILSSDKQIAYIKSTGFGLIIYDVSNPTDLKPLGTLEGGWNSESRAFGKLTLSPEGTTIYLSEGSYGIKVIDVRDPENPVLVSTIPTTGMSNGLILSAAGDKLYSANRAFHNFYRT